MIDTEKLRELVTYLGEANTTVGLLYGQDQFKHWCLQNAPAILALAEENERLKKVSKVQPSRRLPPLPVELYEGYPAMSAQTHEFHVKEYARQALERKPHEG